MHYLKTMEKLLIPAGLILALPIVFLPPTVWPFLGYAMLFIGFQIGLSKAALFVSTPSGLQSLEWVKVCFGIAFPAWLHANYGMIAPFWLFNLLLLVRVSAVFPPGRIRLLTLSALSLAPGLGLLSHAGQLNRSILLPTAILASSCIMISTLVNALHQLRDQKERAETTSQIKSLFLANMSHELRTPLNAIIGYAELLEEDAEFSDKPDDLRVDDLQKITRSGRYLLSLINDILDISEIEARQIKANAKPLVLQEFTDHISSTIGPIASRSENTLTVHFNTVLPQIEVDREKLTQILLGLLDNACKFTSQGAITLHVYDVVATPTMHARICFRVEDTGVGISAERLADLFEPFHAFGTRQASESTGLSLAVAKKLCDLLQGSLKVTSELGVGSSFLLTLPTTPPRATEEPASHKLSLGVESMGR